MMTIIIVIKNRSRVPCANDFLFSPLLLLVTGEGKTGCN